MHITVMFGGTRRYLSRNERAGRLPGLDGNAKMSKSLNNGIYLADDADTLRKKVMSMYTDPDHIRVEDPGKIEGNMVFHYLDVFGRPEDAQEIADMKEHYQRGGLGDVKTKRYLLEILERELGPIRERRIEFAKDMGEVYNMLQKGSERAREVAGQTLSEVKGVMGLHYFYLSLFYKKLSFLSQRKDSFLFTPVTFDKFYRWYDSTI